LVIGIFVGTFFPHNVGFARPNTLKSRQIIYLIEKKTVKTNMLQCYNSYINYNNLVIFERNLKSHFYSSLQFYMILQKSF